MTAGFCHLARTAGERPDPFLSSSTDTEGFSDTSAGRLRDVLSLFGAMYVFFLMWSIGTKLLLRESAHAQCLFSEAAGAGRTGSQT